MRILIVEDDTVIQDGISRALKLANYAVDCASNGADADQMLTAQDYDLAILDLGLPKIDGFEVLRRLRKRKSSTPVLILTARDAVEDRVKGLDIGADDYIIKPFAMPELEARVRALIRRGQFGATARLVNGALSLDTAGRRAYIGEDALDISARELALLEILLLKSGRVVSKEQILERLCNWDEELGSNAIEVYIHRLRKKLEPAAIKIRTIRGLGYLLENPAE
jgi:two-component system, OmpR family, response regulator